MNFNKYFLVVKEERVEGAHKIAQINESIQMLYFIFSHLAIILIFWIILTFVFLQVIYVNVFQVEQDSIKLRVFLNFPNLPKILAGPNSLEDSGDFIFLGHYILPPIFISLINLKKLLNR